MDIVEIKKNFVRRHPWELARFEILLGMINSILPPSEKPKIILDIGCGDCFFAQQLLLRRKDFFITGVDPGYSDISLKTKMSEINDLRFLLFRNLNDAENHHRTNSVQMVLLLDVIEHIEDDIAFLKAIASSHLVTSKTNMIVSVPAFQKLFSKHDFFLQHFRRYNRKQLKATVKTSGFIPFRSGYFFFSPLILRFFQKLKEKKSVATEQKGIGQWEQRGSATELLKKMLLLDYQFSKLLSFIGITLPGLSVYCICKKPAS